MYRVNCHQNKNTLDFQKKKKKKKDTATIEKKPNQILHVIVRVNQVLSLKSDLMTHSTSPQVQTALAISTTFAHDAIATNLHAKFTLITHLMKLSCDPALRDLVRLR